MRPDSLRRVAVFGGLFAVFIGLIAALGGGYVTPDVATDRRLPGEPGPDGRKPGEAPHWVQDAGVGTGKGGRYEYTEMAEIDGERVPVLSSEVSWNEATPRESDDPGNPDLVAQGVSVRLYPAPTESNPRPRPGDGPGVTRVDADQADVGRPGGGAHLRALLRGDVIAKRYDEGPPTDTAPEDLPGVTIETEVLLIERREGEGRRLSTTEPVRISSAGAHVQGRGLTGDTDTGTMEMGSEVRGWFDTRDGRVDVSCEGAARIETIDSRLNVPLAERRQRRITLFDRPRVDEGTNTITCRDRMVIEVPRDAEKEEGRPYARISVFEAHGDFVLAGTRSEGPYRIAADRARRWMETYTEREKVLERDVMILEGGTTASFDGAWGRKRGDQGERKLPGRTRIRCAGPATLTVRKHPDPKLPGVRRFALRFTEDVVVTREDLTTGAVATRLESPKVIVVGNQLADGSFQPEQIVAEDGVHVIHGAVDARARVGSWLTERDTGLQKLLLSGNPQAEFKGASATNPFGQNEEDPADGTVIVTAERDLDIYLYPADDEEAPGVVTVDARGNVRVLKIVQETEPFRLEADQVKALLDGERNLRQATAVGNARILGRAEDGSGRRGEGRGDRIEILSPQGAATSDDIATARLLGSRDRPAVSTIYDERGRHLIRAQRIEYLRGGTALEATGPRAVAEISVPESVGPLGGRGGVTLSGGKIRAELSKVIPGAPANSRQLLRVVATDRVELAGRRARVTGSTIAFDAVRGVADAVGRPAKIELDEAKTEGGQPLTSFVVSETIRAVFVVDGPTRGDLIRASCNGGRIQRFRIPDKAARAGGAAVTRYLVEAAGPITVDSNRASARRDVAITYSSPAPGGRWTAETRILCDELDMTFDSEAEGGLTDRVRGIVAAGTTAHPIRLSNSRLTATADRMESTDQDDRIHLTARPGRSVDVRDKEQGYRYICEPGVSVDYRTGEWESHGRSEIVADEE